MPLRLSATLATLTLALPIMAQETLFVGPRALAMGGTGVASAQDDTASYYNPAIFGQFGRKAAEEAGVDNNALTRWDKFDVGIDVTVGVRQYGQFVDYAQSISDNLDAIDEISNQGLRSESDLLAIVETLNSLEGIDNPANAVGVDLTAGFGTRIGHVGFGLRGWSQLIGRVNSVDNVNVGVANAGGGNISADINNTGSPLAGSVTLLTGLSPAYDANAQLRLEYQAQQAGVTAATAPFMVQTLNNAATAYGSGTALFSNNQTSVLFKGIGIVEVPITYGHPLSPNLSVGGTLNLMRGRVYGTSLLIFDEDAEIKDSLEDFEESFNVGLDLGAFYRMKMLNFGLTLRNLNAPSFSAPSGYGDVSLNREATAGVAFYPFQTFGMALDIDLLKTDSILDGSQYQRVGAGIEWDILRFLALRAGGYKNLAEDDVGNVVTAGIGINLYLLRIDLAGAMAMDTVKVDGEDVPKEARVSFRISTEW